MRTLRLLALAACLWAVPVHAQAALAATAWCGGGERLSADRTPDAAAGPQLHLVYAVPADAPDRFDEIAPRIVGDVQAMRAWWLRQDPSRVPRVDTFDFPGCADGAGRLDVGWIRLPRPSDAYLARDGRLQGLALDLKASLDHPGKKYVVYFDGPIADGNVCGQAFADRYLAGAFGLAAVYLQGPAGCRSEVARRKTLVHEVVHALGALDRPAAGPGPPNACPDDPAHPCDDGLDVLAAGGGASSLDDFGLDRGRDDYYGHDGPWWDVRDSPWLEHTGGVDPGIATAALRVDLRGALDGSRIVSSPPGIDCPETCEGRFPVGVRVRLEMRPTGADRAVWTADHSCPWRGPCFPDLARDRTLVVAFMHTIALRLIGRGEVRSRPAANCNRGCDPTVELAYAVAKRGWRFSHWGGDCRAAGRARACRVVRDRERRIVAVFRPLRR